MPAMTAVGIYQVPAKSYTFWPSKQQEIRTFLTVPVLTSVGCTSGLLLMVRRSTGWCIQGLSLLGRSVGHYIQACNNMMSVVTVDHLVNPVRQRVDYHVAGLSGHKLSGSHLKHTIDKWNTLRHRSVI
jgi:hypothetical protein